MTSIPDPGLRIRRVLKKLLFQNTISIPKKDIYEDAPHGPNIHKDTKP
jgi:hypothetical protein